MFIQTEDTANADRMRFIPGREVLGDGEVTFRNAEEGAGSPLARRLFDHRRRPGDHARRR